MKCFKIIVGAILMCVIWFTPAKLVKADVNDKIILIDPGHGGFDGGAKSKAGTVEKDINLNISLKLREELHKRGYKVCLTREGDDHLAKSGSSIKEKKKADLKRRCELKKETKCDVFISIHQNTFPQSKYYGAQVWYASDEESNKLALNVQNSLREAINDNNKREIKPAGDSYAILRDNYKGACILIECGFLSNPEEDKKLNTDEHQDNLVKGIVMGIDKYFEENNIS